MKIRSNFVSNSSSSSFLIYGLNCDGLERQEEYNTKKINKYGEEYDESDESFGDLFCDSDLYIHGYETSYLGLSWSKVKDDETGKQFKERIEQSVKELLIKYGFKTDNLEFNTHEECYYS